MAWHGMAWQGIAAWHGMAWQGIAEHWKLNLRNMYVRLATKICIEVSFKVSYPLKMFYSLDYTERQTQRPVRLSLDDEYDFETNDHYSTTLNFGVLPLVEIYHVTRWWLSPAGAYQRIVPILGIFAQNLALSIKTIESFCPRPYVW